MRINHVLNATTCIIALFMLISISDSMQMDRRDDDHHDLSRMKLTNIKVNVHDDHVSLYGKDRDGVYYKIDHVVGKMKVERIDKPKEWLLELPELSGIIRGRTVERVIKSMKRVGDFNQDANCAVFISNILMDSGVRIPQRLMRLMYTAPEHYNLNKKPQEPNHSFLSSLVRLKDVEGQIERDKIEMYDELFLTLHHRSMDPNRRMDEFRAKEEKRLTELKNEVDSEEEFRSALLTAISESDSAPMLLGYILMCKPRSLDPLINNIMAFLIAKDGKDEMGVTGEDGVDEILMLSRLVRPNGITDKNLKKMILGTFKKFELK